MTIEKLKDELQDQVLECAKHKCGANHDDFCEKIDDILWDYVAHKFHFDNDKNHYENWLEYSEKWDDFINKQEVQELFQRVFNKYYLAEVHKKKWNSPIASYKIKL